MLETLKTLYRLWKKMKKIKLERSFLRPNCFHFFWCSCVVVSSVDDFIMFFVDRYKIAYVDKNRISSRAKKSQLNDLITKVDIINENFLQALYRRLRTHPETSANNSQS
jgi:hypothetical protein